MLTLQNLILYEYFPAELPGCFTTEKTIRHLSCIKGRAMALKYRSSIALHYSGFKSESARRKFAVPNFYNYLICH